MTQPGYIRSLDGLRCLAVLIVIWEHAGAGSSIKGFGNHGVGVYGVWLFFVLSGFLITGILLRERDRVVEHAVTLWGALRTFYVRRFLRIFPVYYLLLAILAATALVPGVVRDLWWYVTYTANWMMAERARFPVGTGHLWSLAVEEQFYLGWPLLVLLTSTRRVPWLFGGTVLLALASRVIASQGAANSISVLTPTTSNLDCLAIGALLAWHRHVQPDATGARRSAVGAAAIFGALLIAMNLYLSVVVHRGWRIFNLTEALSASLVGVWLCNAAADGSPRVLDRALAWPPFAYVGKISYGVYLYHYVLIYGFRHWAPLRAVADVAAQDDGLKFFLVAACASIGTAALSWHLFEAPINGLKRRFPYD